MTPCTLIHTNSSAAQRILFSAVFVMAFYESFRIGELAAKSSNSSTNTVIQYYSLRLLKLEGQIHLN